MFKTFSKLFDYNEQQLKKLRTRIEEVNALEDKARVLKDAAFSKETALLKEQIASGSATLDELMPWAFALTREASRRVLGLRHYDVQLMAGLALHNSNVIEQRTGEGKTLSATTALYLNALTGKGAHLVTVNDYLARRDAGWMGGIFHMLGLSISAIISQQAFLYDPEFTLEGERDWRLAHLRPISRKEAYDCDVTYGVNSEFGFDYLRDNMAISKQQQVQRGYNYAIIDEVDSVLIDEARTPHIISAPYEQDVSTYYEYVKLIERLDPENDYVLDEKLRAAHLTEQGIVKLEKLMKVDNIYQDNYEAVFHVEAALKAKTLFKRDKDYIVRGDEIVIVDEFTGRLLDGRRYSDGIHQALEAKEGVAIRQEQQTLATVSLQNYFRMYEKLAGMTGTAATEAEEFHKIYNMDVLTMPTHLPINRIDHTDQIFQTERGKFTALVEAIAEAHKEGRPVLVGTTSIDKNEIIGSLLKKKGVPHNLLNAKNHESEASIIANAGKKGAVTVATNMAGRGVDIVLGGAQPSILDFDPELDEAEREKLLHAAMKEWREKHDEVIAIGGLYVMGTERHESRRIDNQLRGRAGRQGDPGDTRFFVSVEDDMMRIFGGDQMKRIMTMFNVPENEPLEHTMITRVLEAAQKKVEGFNFDSRKSVVEQDDVLNKQRKIIYDYRSRMLGLPDKADKETKKTVVTLIDQLVSRLRATYTGIEIPVESLVDELRVILPMQEATLMKKIEHLIGDELWDTVRSLLLDRYAHQLKTIGEEVWGQLVRIQLLTTVDAAWTRHLTAIEDLKQGINLRAKAQLDPTVEYKNEAFIMFEQLIADIDLESLRRVMNVEVTVQQVEQAQEELEQKQEKLLKKASLSDVATPKSAVEEVKEMSGESVERGKQEKQAKNGGGASLVGSAAKKPGRNDPCWCGSGKKYKRCHYPN